MRNQVRGLFSLTRTIFSVASVVMLFYGKEVFAQAQGNSTSLTGSQIMARCQWTYDHLQSYQAAISVHLKPDYKHPQFNPPPGYPDPVAKAHLRYLRPGKVIVSGFSYLNPKKPTYFRLLCRDSKAWWYLRTKASVLIDGDKEKQNKAVLELSGPSFLTATSLPSIFLHSDWGWPVGLEKAASVEDKVVTAIVAGRPCYGVQKSSRYAVPERYWVDQKTFLLVQIEDNDMQETFTETRVNPSIAAGTFLSP